MYCPNRITHTVKQGDTPARLARQYNTTIDRILAENPNLNPTSMHIGDQVIICPNSANAPQQSDQSSRFTAKQINLMNMFRMLWEQHIMWTHAVVTSIASSLPDDSVVTARLLKNPKDMASVFRRFYGDAVANNLEKLFTEHLTIGKQYLIALKNQSSDAEQINKQWHENADQIAAYMSSINPYYDQNEIRNMYYEHLKLVANQGIARDYGNYPADVEAYDTGEQHALKMADEFTRGLIRQFPQKFQ